jgi:hypothetical protein
LRINFTAPLIYIFLFSSCEGFIHIEGKTFDSTSRQPINNVQVFLIVKGKDTIRKNQTEFDSLSFDQRKTLRKQGMKDDYKWHVPGGLSKYRLSLSDTSGYFTVGSILVPCMPKCPKCKLIFIKRGYRPVTVETSSIKQDSINVFLEKLDR